jgi:hypothetical protein
LSRIFQSFLDTLRQDGRDAGRSQRVFPARLAELSLSLSLSLSLCQAGGRVQPFTSEVVLDAAGARGYKLSTFECVAVAGQSPTFTTDVDPSPPPARAN